MEEIIDLPTITNRELVVKAERFADVLDAIETARRDLNLIVHKKFDENLSAISFLDTDRQLTEEKLAEFFKHYLQGSLKDKVIIQFKELDSGICFSTIVIKGSIRYKR